MGEEVANTVVGKVLDILFSAAKREIDFIRKGTENVEQLRNETGKLKDMKGRIQQQIEIAKGKGEVLVHGLQEWVGKANEQVSKAEEFLEEEANAKKTCFNLRINLSTLYRYSKLATKKVPSLQQHHEAGKTYESNVSIPATMPGFLELYERKNLDDIDTQKSILSTILEAINDESIQIIGIYGFGGVGKTTLAKEVAATVKDLFADVVFITVSHQVNVEKITKEVEVAANRIMKNEKILIILDDIWRKLKLDEVGIPCGIRYMNCKILFTCRSKNVCSTMDAQSEICVNPLPNEEAWILFKGAAGERVETDTDLSPIAWEVMKECGGLPLILQVVGKALENKNIDFWKSSRDRLKNHAPLNIDQEIDAAFLHLELSYNLLKNEEAKLCFLLCSMFPEDALIPLERLALYGVGLGKFKDIDSIEDARNKVVIAVDTLKSSFLLLDGDDQSTTKMHDIVRNVALSIASQGQNNFSVKAGNGLTEWRPDRGALKNYTGISLMENNICKLPNHGLVCPLLDTLLLQGNYNLSTISDEFIQGVKEVRVLDMERNNIPSLPRSLAQLTRLCLLNLGGNKNLKEICVLGDLKYLEILILNDTGIEKIPQELGQLEYLRRLEVKCCPTLSHIAPGVISKLHGLEELHIGHYLTQEGNYNSLMELSNLSRLTFLNLFVPNFDLIPEGVDFGTLKGFMIQIGGYEHIVKSPWKPHSEHCLILGIPFLKIPLLTRIRKLIEVSHHILLESVENLNDILPDLFYEGFDRLNSIAISKCDNLSCLMNTRDWDQKFLSKLEHLNLSHLFGLEAIWSCPDQYISLINLATINIDNCHKLERLFSVSVAQGLVNLQKLSIKTCYFLKEVIWARYEETVTSEIEVVAQTTNIVFPRLVHISLFNLRVLESFCSGHSTIKYPSLVKVHINYCMNMKRWGYGVHESPKLKFVTGVPLDGPCAINDAVMKRVKSKPPKRGQIKQRIFEVMTTGYV